jgi:hypothetical protein
MIAFATSRPSSRDSTTPTTPNLPDPPRSYTSQPSMIKAEGYRPLENEGAYSTALQDSPSQYDQPPPTEMRLEKYGQLAPDASFTGTLQESSLQYGQRPSSNIDPALMRPGLQPMSMYEDRDFGNIYGRPDPQYAQSYERYRSLTPGNSYISTTTSPRSNSTNASSRGVFISNRLRVRKPKCDQFLYSKHHLTEY